MRCPIIRGAVAPCFSASARNCRRKLAHHVTVERVEVGDKHAVEDREQQQRIFQRLSECFSSVRSATVPAPTAALGFGRSIAFDMEQWGYRARPEA